jgi:hypothetical protein
LVNLGSTNEGKILVLNVNLAIVAGASRKRESPVSNKRDGLKRGPADDHSIIGVSTRDID